MTEEECVVCDCKHCVCVCVCVCVWVCVCVCEWVCVCVCVCVCKPTGMGYMKRLLHLNLRSYTKTRGAGGWGTALQAGRSRVRFPMVSLDFFIDIILPVGLWPWGWLILKQKWVPEMFPGVKAAGAYGWQPYHLHVPIVLKSGSLNLLELSGPV